MGGVGLSQPVLQGVTKPVPSATLRIHRGALLETKEGGWAALKGQERTAMKTMLKRTVLVTSLFAAGSLLAYGPGLGGFGFPGHHGWGGHMTGMGHGPIVFLDGDVAARLDRIKAELAITPVQESAWSQFADSVKAHAETARTVHEGWGWRPGTSFAGQQLPLMWQQREAIHEAAGNLVSVLDPAQQRRAEGLISYGMQHPF